MLNPDKFIVGALSLMALLAVYLLVSQSWV